MYAVDLINGLILQLEYLEIKYQLIFIKKEKFSIKCLHFYYVNIKYYVKFGNNIGLKL